MVSNHLATANCELRVPDEHRYCGCCHRPGPPGPAGRNGPHRGEDRGQKVEAINQGLVEQYAARVVRVGPGMDAWRFGLSEVVVEPCSYAIANLDAVAEPLDVPVS